jgi:hypothetical protein
MGKGVAWPEIRAWFTDLVEWVWAVVKQWIPLVTGGVITASFSVAGVLTSKPSAWLIGLWVFGGAVLLSTFQAWRKERNENAAIEVRSITLRVRAFACWREMRDFYEAHKGDANLPAAFFDKYETRICEFKDSMAAAIGPDKISWGVVSGQRGYWDCAEKIGWLIHDFRREASQVAEDIPA